MSPCGIHHPSGGWPRAHHCCSARASPTRLSRSCSRHPTWVLPALRPQARLPDQAYYSQPGEGLLKYVGPLVETHVHEKPLSIALREINQGLLLEPNEPQA